MKTLACDVCGGTELLSDNASVHEVTVTSDAGPGVRVQAHFRLVGKPQAYVPDVCLTCAGVLLGQAGKFLVNPVSPKGPAAPKVFGAEGTEAGTPNPEAAK